MDIGEALRLVSEGARLERKSCAGKFFIELDEDGRSVVITQDVGTGDWIVEQADLLAVDWQLVPAIFGRSR